MKNFCTVSDSKYLHFGLALHESLSRSAEEYTLYYFCTDDESYNFLNEYSDNLIPISIPELLKNNEDLIKLKEASKTESMEAANCSQQEGLQEPAVLQFLYSLSTFSTNYCLTCLNLDHIMYVDADIFFFEDFKYAFNDVGSKSVGLVEHRLPFKHEYGEFNVGIVYFKNDSIGKSASNLWLGCMQDPNNKWAAQYAAYGDQKYLEIVYANAGDGACIIGDTCGHLAPWNIPYHQYNSNKGEIVWAGRSQKFVYFHFSSFILNKDGSYILGRRHGMTDIDIPFIQVKVRQYADLLIKFKKNISENINNIKEYFNLQLQLNKKQFSGELPRPPHWGNMITDIQELCNDDKNINTIKDLGCGSGALYRVVNDPWIQSSFDKKIHYYGYDISEHAIKLAKENYSNDHFFTQDACKIDSSFVKNNEILYMSALLDVMKDGNTFLKNICSMKFKYIIIHRVQFTTKTSFFTMDRPYGVCDMPMSFHNKKEFIKVISKDYHYTIKNNDEHDYNIILNLKS